MVNFKGNFRYEHDLISTIFWKFSNYIILNNLIFSKIKPNYFLQFDLVSNRRDIKYSVLKNSKRNIKQMF